jgi:hypothetical protein
VSGAGAIDSAAASAARLQHGRVALGLRPPGRDDEGDRQLLEARHEEHQEPQRGGVRPVRVIDDHAQRPPLREVGAEPVEAVEDGERGVLVGDGGLGALRGARQAEQPGGHAGRAPEELGRPLHRPERRLDELAHDAEGELALQLGTPGAEDAHPRRFGHRPGVGQQRGLAHARRALDHDEHAAAVTGPGEGAVHARQVALSLQQPTRHCLDAHAAIPDRADAGEGGPTVRRGPRRVQGPWVSGSRPGPAG